MDRSDIIRRARRNVGLSQRGLAQALGVSAGLVGQWETPALEKGIGVDLLVKLAAVLQIPVTRLLDGAADGAEPGMSLTKPNEVALISLYRRMPEALQQNHLSLFYATVANLRHEAGGPGDGERVAPGRSGQKAANA